ncbi:MAG: tRNA pseudouridine synthase A [Chlamydiae bacterium]|nr:tRNA pseudouridine synthase A [Chlamydiota bacterium]
MIDPFKRLYSYHLPYPIDLEILKQAKNHFIGEHDFTSFSNEAHRGSAARGATRNLKRLDLTTQDNEIILEFEANGFLYKMVRNVVGTLLDVARGKLFIDSIPEIFATKDRCKAAATAPAHGLFLVKVIYI